MLNLGVATYASLVDLGTLITDLKAEVTTNAGAIMIFLGGALILGVVWGFVRKGTKKAPGAI